MPKDKDEIITEIRALYATLTPEYTSARLASIAYNILDLVIQLNNIEKGKYRQEILSLSLTLDKELAYAHEIGKDLYIKYVQFVTEEQLRKAKNAAIDKIRLDLGGLL
jgi:hypothetical protein